MGWLHFFIAVGYLIGLLAIMVLLHGGTLLYKDLYRRRDPANELPEPKSMSARHA